MNRSSGTAPASELPPSRFRQLGKETFTYGLGGVAAKFINFFLLPVYTRVFSPSDYGIMDVIATMTALLGILLTGGTGTALSYYFFKLRTPEERQKTVTVTGLYLLAVNACVAAVIWAAAGPICRMLFGTVEYALYLRIGVLSIPFSALVTLHLNLLRLQRRPRLYLGVSLPRLVVSLLLNIYLVVILRIGIVGVFWSQLIVAVLFAAVGFLINRSFFRLGVDRERLVQLLRYGLPLVIGGLSLWSINYLNRFFLLRYAGLEDIGRFAVGLRLASVAAFVTQAFRTANAPFQFEVAAEKDAPHVYGRTLSYYIFATSLICVPLSLFARPILRVVTTEAYVTAYVIVPLAAYAAVAYGVYQLVSVGLLVTQRTGFTGTAIGLGAVLNVGYLFALVPSFGMVGAATATLLTHASVVAILFVGSQRAYRIPYDLGRVFRMLATAGVVIALGMLNAASNPWMEGLVAVGLFALFVALILPQSGLSGRVGGLIKATVARRSP